jgi:hypothetical protein
MMLLDSAGRARKRSGRGLAARFSKGRQRPLALIASLVLLLGIGSATALAGHGSWSSHGLRLYYPGTASQHSYADVGATNTTDYSHVLWQGPPGSETVTCTGGCGYRKTATRYFGGGYPQLSSSACARDGTHMLSGKTQLYPPCSASYTCEGCPTHIHNSATFVWPP